MSDNKKPDYDELLVVIINYVYDMPIQNNIAFKTAYVALLDSLGCAMLALQNPACVKLLGPIIPGTTVPSGVGVPGTPYKLDPIQAAFNIGILVRWLDYNDTWLAKEWGHPSDNLGGILAAAQYVNFAKQSQKLTVKDILEAMIKAYEIQGVLALENAFNVLGLDHVILVKVATTAVVSKLLGLNKIQALAALSHAWIDGQSLRIYRHAPNTGSRKCWAAGDATSRALTLVWRVMWGEPGIPSALTAKKWGFNDVYLGGKSLVLKQPLHSYVMEHVLFKVAYPAEFHAQTALEAAIALHSKIKPYLSELSSIDRIVIETQEPGFRIIHKDGQLHNESDRDHCIQYIVAVGLLFGHLESLHYTDAVAKDPAIEPKLDQLRQKMIVTENTDFTKAYYDSMERAIPNAVQVFFKDGSCTERVVMSYPLGHPKRRREAMPLLKQKYEDAMRIGFKNKANALEKVLGLWDKGEEVFSKPIDEFMACYSQ